MKKSLIILIHCTWGIIQTLCGLVWFVVQTIKRGKIEIEWVGHSFHSIMPGRSDGVSLGLFSFNGESCEDHLLEQKDIKHENGHSIQALKYGPLYLIVVGIPSLINYHNKDLDGYDKQGYRKYYQVWPENNADKLGGVNLEERCKK